MVDRFAFLTGANVYKVGLQMLNRYGRSVVPAAIVAAVLGSSACAGTSSFSAVSHDGAQSMPVQRPQTATADQCSTKACIYVTDRYVNQITVYTKGAHGNVAPLRNITGASTGLNEPIGIALDSSRAVHVANFTASSITVYAPNSNGNVAPTITISGSKTKMNGPVFVALDSSGKSYVVNFYGASVEVFAAGASGNVALASISACSCSRSMSARLISMSSDLELA